MVLEITAAQEEQLARIANQQGTTVENLLTDAALSIIQIDEHHWASVERALEQAERGEFIEEDDMDARIEKMLAGK